MSLAHELFVPIMRVSQTAVNDVRARAVRRKALHQPNSAAQEPVCDLL